MLNCEGEGKGYIEGLEPDLCSYVAYFALHFTKYFVKFDAKYTKY